jgi:hypothetical protein
MAPKQGTVDWENCKNHLTKKTMTKYTGEIRPLGVDLSILKDLKLQDQPVGIKFMFDKPEGIKRLDKNMAICIMPEEVQSHGAFYVDADNFECAEPLWLGFANDDPASNSGQIGTKEGNSSRRRLHIHGSNFSRSNRLFSSAERICS